MFNYLIKIEYDGTKFVGWQTQKNGISVQDSVEKALKKIFRKKTKVKKKIENKKVFLDSINFFLKNKLISILDIKEKNLNFHARFNAKLRTYEYLIINRQGSLSINKNRGWHVKKKIDLKLMKRGAKIFEGTHDFSTFRAASCSSKSSIKNLQKINIKKTSDMILIKFSSKSFLQNQVRSMVGCLKYLSTSKWSLNQFIKAFRSKKRINCAPPAPACGLYLSKVIY